MTLYVNNSRRKVKFKLRNKLFNAAAAAAAAGARAARSCQRMYSPPKLKKGKGIIQ